MESAISVVELYPRIIQSVLTKCLEYLCIQLIYATKATKLALMTVDG